MFQTVAFVHHRSIYKTRPFVAALKEAFGDGRLFGGHAHSSSYQTKVAVTSVSDSGQNAVLISNYNRVQAPEDLGKS